MRTFLLTDFYLGTLGTIIWHSSAWWQPHVVWRDEWVWAHVHSLAPRRGTRGSAGRALTSARPAAAHRGRPSVVSTTQT